MNMFYLSTDIVLDWIVSSEHVQSMVFYNVQESKNTLFSHWKFSQEPWSYQTLFWCCGRRAQEEAAGQRKYVSKSETGF